jgi:DHA2 family multidrug resistance protein
MSAMALAVLVPWELTRKDPIVDIRLLTRRQFGTCFFVMLLVGAILISTTQLIPQLLQTELGYTAMLAGMALSPGGVVLMILMPLAGQLTDKIQPRYLIAFGLTVVALSMWYLTGLDGDITFAYAAWARIFTAAGLPFLFIPLATASYGGLPQESTNQAAGLFNVARNLGGSIGVALTQTLEQRREQFHHSRLSSTSSRPASTIRRCCGRSQSIFWAGARALATRSRVHSIGLPARSSSRQCSFLISMSSGCKP